MFLVCFANICLVSVVVSGTSSCVSDFSDLIVVGLIPAGDDVQCRLSRYQVLLRGGNATQPDYMVTEEPWYRYPASVLISFLRCKEVVWMYSPLVLSKRVLREKKRRRKRESRKRGGEPSYQLPLPHSHMIHVELLRTLLHLQ